MKEYTITQTYTMTVSTTVHVPDDMKVHEIQERFDEFPISVVVESQWDDYAYENDTVSCDNDISLDAVMPVGMPLVYKDGILQTRGLI